ncbi:MAG: arginine--tRNA ligase [bacterium]|nr:arginine--tRNA ligase [bacterium]
MVREVLQKMIEKAVASARAGGALTAEEIPPIILENPPREDFGDYSCNLPLLLAKPERKAPLAIADVLRAHLPPAEEMLADVQVAKPGFLNFYLKTEYLTDRLGGVLRDPKGFGRSDMGGGEKILLEYVSANPTGPLHIGHGRGAAVGDVLARILRFTGFDVDCEYYINDAGNQMEMLGKSAYCRYLESRGEKVKFPEEGYQGEYIREIAKSPAYIEAIRAAAGTPAAEMSASVRETARIILEDIRRSLDGFRVRFDRWFSENSLFADGRVEKAIARLEAASKIYEESGAKWLKSKEYGDEKNRVVVREDGRPTYLASDIAYHLEKFERGYSRCINIWGADHHGYLPRVRAAVEMMGFDPKRLEVLFVQFVSLRRGGNPVQMSTRSGQFEELSTVVDEVGVDAARFFFLMRSVDTTLEFDLDLAKEQSSENPVYYVQYGHARTCSLFRQAAEQGVSLEGMDAVPSGGLKLPEEHQLAKAILEWPEVIRMAAERREPHRLTFALMALAKQFHAYYNRHRVLTDDPTVTRARLCLARCVQSVLACGLALLGVAAPEKM